MKETIINSSNYLDVYNALCPKKQIIRLDPDDLLMATKGKSGVVYKESKQQGMCTEDFLINFLGTLRSKEQVLECSHCIIQINGTESDDFFTEHMGILHDFFETLGDEKNVLWGMGMNPDDMRMTITVICTK